MEKMKKIAVVLLISGVLVGALRASLVYDDFESYTVGAEGSGAGGDLWNNYSPAMSGGHPASGNPFLTPYADSAVSFAGGKSIRLDAPLLIWDDTAQDIVPSAAGWGVIIRDDGTTTNVEQYNAMTAMIKTAGPNACRIIVRDASNVEVGNDIITLPNDGNWHKLTVVLDGAGTKTAVQRILPFISGIAADATGAQIWIDNLVFENVKLANDILDVDGVGGPVGGTAVYSFVMTEQPGADVTFTLDPAAQLDFGAGFGEPVNLTFTNSNWNVPQVINVAIIDIAATGLVGVNVSVSSAAAEYDEAIDGGFNVPIFGEYGAYYEISPNTPPWGASSSNSGDSGIDLANGAVAPNFYLPLDAGLSDFVEWAPNAYSPAKPAYAEITFNFGYAKDVEFIDIYYGTGSFPPGAFDISYSSDGVNYSTPVNYPAFIGGTISKTHIENAPAVNAQYVKLIARCVNDDAGKWFFLSEVMFNVPLPVRIPPYYSIDTGNIPAGRNQDPQEDKLFNGVISYAAASTDYVFFENSAQVAYDNVTLYADYGQTREFSYLTLNYFAGWGVNAPTQVKLSFSDDGENYGTPIALSGWYQSGGAGCTDSKSFTPQIARYVKIEFTRSTASVHALRLGEIILSNRAQITYAVDASTPVWGGASAASGDVAGEANLGLLRFGDLANGYVAKLVGPGSDPDWVEWAPNAFSPANPAYAIITFDLRSVTTVKNASIVYCAFFNSGASVPGGLEAAFSTDGTNFGEFAPVAGEFSDNTEESEIFQTVFDLPDTDARYVKLKIKCKNDDPGNWFFLSEIKFNVFGADVNDNGAVDEFDFDQMAAQWLQDGWANVAGDDDVVDMLDFSQLAADWLL